MEWHPAADPTVVRARGRRLEWILVALAVCAAGLLASLALAWSVITVPETALNTGVGAVPVHGGAVSLTGRQMGMAEPVMVAVGILAVGALLAYRTWWWASGMLVVVLVSRLGASVPMPGGRGSTSLATPGPGLELVRVLWPASFALLALATAQAYLVRQAAREQTTPAGGDLRDVLRRALGAAWNVAQDAARPTAPKTGSPTGRAPSAPTGTTPGGSP